MDSKFNLKNSFNKKFIDKRSGSPLRILHESTAIEQQLITFTKKAVRAMSDFFVCKLPRAPVNDPFDNFTPNFPLFLMTVTCEGGKKIKFIWTLINFRALIT